MIKTPIVLSILIHIVILLILLSITFKPSIITEEKPIKVTIINSIEKRSEHKKDIDKSSHDIVERSNIRNNEDIEISEKGDYIDDIISPEPDIIINSSALGDITDIPNTGDLEESLTKFMGDIDILDDIKEDTSYDIVWDGEEREAVTNTHIDFSLFPKTAFTGVGLHINFMVNLNGEVYDVIIAPPGSGSTEFDILIIQQVSKFKFRDSSSISKGEVYIVYQK